LSSPLVPLFEARRLQAAGNLPAARERYAEVLRALPDCLEALHGLGVIEGMSGRWTEAADLLARAVRIDPLHAHAHCDLGLARKSLRQWQAALASYDRAIALLPGLVEAHSNRGNVLRECGATAAALAAYDRAITLRPDYPQAHYNRGVALQDLNRLPEALESYSRAIDLRPDYAQAHGNRGVVLERLHRFEEALAAYDRALQINGDFVQAHANRGNVLRALDRIEESIASCDRALALEPGHAGAHLNRGLARLLQGDLRDGWPDYEWRWRDERSLLYQDRRSFDEPAWRGATSPAGKTLLVYSEQGLGDTLQFCRYLPVLAQRGARIVFEVQPALARLLGTQDLGAALIVRGDPLPSFDQHCPLLSLPLALGTDLASIPADLPYLRAPAAASRDWAARLGPWTKPRVGLVWSGGFHADQGEVRALNERRNIPLAMLAPLGMPDIEFYSLQKGEPAESELARAVAAGWTGPAMHDVAGRLDDFCATAALLDHLDLVIAVDTSTAHLAGAMGKPVWLLNRFDTCWRWLRGRSDSPWYPSLTLYRQERPGAWDGVVERVRRDLARLAGAARQSSEISRLAISASLGCRNSAWESGQVR